MKFLARLFALTMAMLMSHSIGAAAPDPKPQPQLTCDIGPINKTYGKTEWLVYSCSDGLGVVLVSAPGSPAFPFVFSFMSKENRYDLIGQGTGRKEATAAAYKELRELREPEIKALLDQTKDVPKKKP